MLEDLVSIAWLPTLASMQLLLIVVLALFAIISLLLVMVFQQYDPNFVKNGGLVGLAFRAITGRNPTLGEQALILSPVALLLVLAFCL